MKVFITGGTGLIGTETVKALNAHGHTVIALSRSEAKSKKLQSLGASRVAIGSLSDLALLDKEASEADAVIHLGFDHDLMFAGGPSGVETACAGDRAAIKAMCEGLLKKQSPSGGQKIFIGASGVLTKLGPDEKAGSFQGDAFPRYLSDDLIFSYSDRLKSYVAAFAPVVHGPDKIHPFIGGQIEAAKKNGFVAIIEDGQNQWAAAHVKDAASLLVAALESDKIPNGSTLHAIGEEGIPLKQIAEYLAKRLNMETKSITKEDAQQQLGFVGVVMALGIRTTTEYTRQWTGWSPKEYTLFEELDKATF